MRKSRQKRKALTECNNVTKKMSQCDTEKEYRVKSLDIRALELDKEADAEENGDDSDEQLEKLEPFRYANVFLSDKQVEELLKVMDIKVFDAYVDKIANYPNVKNHFQTILKWYNEDKAVKK